MNSTFWVVLAVVVLIALLVLILIRSMRGAHEPSWRDGEGRLEEGLWAKIGRWLFWWI